MTRQSRNEMMAQTRLSLIEVARRQFGTVGFARTVMDDMTGEAGLTRGALYHHFGSKKGLFLAVYQQVDQEMDERLRVVAMNAPDDWSALTGRCQAYLKMATEPDIQRIILRDATSVLDSEVVQAVQLNCVTALATLLKKLMAAQEITEASPVMLARMLNGALMDAALWIARSKSPAEAFSEASETLDVFLAGLRKPKA
ncbi:TetR/AcrR family transcriptional regulator [Photobacterium galatheae]|uniref:TetR family transcriptional regulator n=1 Tax=Photobacterium galatheae TaxID=1654360 RepID=A0A066RP96_9GAMM|nr:TetR/AcrR family transcriptional regulator [Photobacterium galatheae]KDM92280.1 TetR family transcriptional regulator [Photobacterium galatheae]MCM0150539.1 TetR/AcrR family transcriptional regulator [Photobacterium galatheae]